MLFALAVGNGQDFPGEIILTENVLFIKSRIYTWKFLISPKAFDSSSRKSEVACPASPPQEHIDFTFLLEEKKEN